MSPHRASAPFTSGWEHFEFRTERGVATITFDRPDRLNALTFDVYADLRDLLEELEHRSEVRVVVITGRGRGFCSGGDISEIIGALVEMDTRDLLDFTRMTGSVVQKMRALPKPIIAAVNGVAAGAGAVIALASDVRVLARSASFRFLLTQVGLAGADMGSAYLLPRTVGLGMATELLLFGEEVGADRAVEIGLASHVVEDDDLAGRVAEIALRLAAGPALAFGATKSLIAKEQDMDLAGSLELEASMQALLMTTEDHKQFFAAFQEGRTPDWKGR